MLCKYKDIFGKVGEGVHSYRIFDIAIIDVLLVVIAAYVINHYYPQYEIKMILVYLFIIGIISHRLFCVRTTIDKLLFNK